MRQYPHPYLQRPNSPPCRYAHELVQGPFEIDCPCATPSSVTRHHSIKLGWRAPIFTQLNLLSQAKRTLH